MAGVKRNVSSASSSSSSALKWQNFPQRRPGTASGKKPLPDPTSVQKMAVMLVLHICRKIIFYDPQLKVGMYFGGLFFSIVFDFLPIPRGYFSQKNNVINVYMVKVGWGWTFVVVATFVGLTSWVYCCGDRSWVKKHLTRMLIGTAVWYIWTSLFVYIEAITGTCIGDKNLTRAECFKTKGARWYGFDVSGHSFLLIYCSLLIMEESKAFRNWERIGELLRNEEFDDDSPLKPLSEEQLSHLRKAFETLSPYIKCMFIALTFLVVVWDVMLVFTLLYFHTMVQKVAGGMIAIISWYLTYRVWYHSAQWSPGLPGQGPFKYDVAPKFASSSSSSK